jgi:hypothetical protein
MWPAGNRHRGRVVPARAARMARTGAQRNGGHRVPHKGGHDRGAVGLRWPRRSDRRPGLAKQTDPRTVRRSGAERGYTGPGRGSRRAGLFRAAADLDAGVPPSCRGSGVPARPRRSGHSCACTSHGPPSWTARIGSRPSPRPRARPNAALGDDRARVESDAATGPATTVPHEAAPADGPGPFRRAGAAGGPAPPHQGRLPPLDPGN